MAHFDAVLTTNKHELVAATLGKAILDGDLKARGLLDVKNGDGSYIARPTSTDLGDMINRFIALSDSTINDFYEIRFALEVKACELATTRSTGMSVSSMR